MGLMAENSVLMTGPAGSETMNNKPPEATVWALGQRLGAATKRNEKYFSKNLQKDCHVHSLFFFFLTGRKAKTIGAEADVGGI